MIEELQIEKRMNRLPSYANAPNTWSPQPAKKATKQDFLRLLKTINTRKYEDPKRKKKNVGIRGVRTGILK